MNHIMIENCQDGLFFWI